MDARQLTDHQVVPKGLVISVTDSPGPGGANHRYDITGFDTDNNPSAVAEFGDSPGYRSRFTRSIVLFQNGPIPEVGANGITMEALLAIVIDRLRGFQSGKFACRDNAIALTHLEDALMRLQARTRERMRRGVEGTLQK